MQADAILLGRRTYDSFAAVWPSVEDPTGYAVRMNSLSKYVASRSLEHAGWNNSWILSSDVVTDVGDLNEGTLLAFGSAMLLHHLLRHELVDEMNLMIYPVVVGRGVRLFPECWAGRWETLEQRPLGDGIILLRLGAVRNDEKLRELS